MRKYLRLLIVAMLRALSAVAAALFLAFLIGGVR